VLGIIRDKYLQKLHFTSHEIPLLGAYPSSTMNVTIQSCRRLGLLLNTQVTQRCTYDGKNNAVPQWWCCELKWPTKSLGVKDFQQVDGPTLKIRFTTARWESMVDFCSNGQDTKPNVNAIPAEFRVPRREPAERVGRTPSRMPEACNQRPLIRGVVRWSVFHC
jgi:hypothetical protein